MTLASDTRSRRCNIRIATTTVSEAPDETDGPGPLHAVALVALAGCSDATGVTLFDLVGTWRAVRFETSDPSTGEKIDWLAAGALAEFAMTITPAGRVVFRSREPHEVVADTSVGTVSLAGDRVTITADGDVLSGTLRLDGDVLTIDIPSFEVWDEIYTLVMVFRRS